MQLALDYTRSYFLASLLHWSLHCSTVPIGVVQYCILQTACSQCARLVLWVFVNQLLA